MTKSQGFEGFFVPTDIETNIMFKIVDTFEWSIIQIPNNSVQPNIIILTMYLQIKVGLKTYLFGKDFLTLNSSF